MWIRGGAAALALSVVVVPANAQAPVERPIEVGKVFPYYDRYLKLPAADRTRWSLSYRLMVSDKPATGVKLWYSGAAGRTPVSISPDGRVSPLPTPEQIKAKTMIAAAPVGTKFSVNLDVVPSIAPAAVLDARELAAAADQATRGAKKAAGPLGLAVPRFERIWFNGASGGTVETPTGVKPLPTRGAKATPYFDPAAWPGATEVRFQTAPVRLLLGPASKG